MQQRLDHLPRAQSLRLTTKDAGANYRDHQLMMLDIACPASLACLAYQPRQTGCRA